MMSSFLNYDDIRYISQSLGIVNDGNKQTYIAIPREDSAISLKKSYLEIKFDVKHEAGDALHADGDRIKIVNLGSYNSFSKIG